ncbi:hypothetical protein C8F04DRAFT_1201786 [Mycena alexandri]|uniref:Uncharacterized protein n=1 Tax=Mycena alexandri TaxID=1745969 RepID=A0AAD6S0I0_9AGAR|nr:hypothetical protein C8F04DRAFT_1201786 [Mycena alexandri]
MSESSHGSRASGRVRFRRTFRSCGIAVVNRGNWFRISVVSIVSVRAQRELSEIMYSLDGKNITALFILNRDLVSKWHAAFVHCAKAREKKLHAAFSTIKKQHAAWTQSSPVTDLPQARYAPALFPLFTYFKIPAKSTNVAATRDSKTPSRLAKSA